MGQEVRGSIAQEGRGSKIRALHRRVGHYTALHRRVEAQGFRASRRAAEPRRRVLSPSRPHRVEGSTFQV